MDEQQERKQRLEKLFDRLVTPSYPGMISIGAGWEKLVLELDAELAKIDPDYTIVQVKEKFAGLRFYASSETTRDYDNLVDSPFFKAIGIAERLSFTICEDCGEPGSERGKWWIVTLCEKCFLASKKFQSVK